MARIKNLFLLALIAGVVWFAATRGLGLTGGGSDARLAESACTAAISARFDGQPVKPYAVDANARGYVVRASVTVRGKQPAKVYCIANDHGGVEELRVVEW